MTIFIKNLHGIEARNPGRLALVCAVSHGISVEHISVPKRDLLTEPFN